MASDSTVAGTLGERRLTTIHAIGQSLAIGPIASAGLVTGLIAHFAGFNTPLSVLLGAIGAFGLGYTVSLYARRYAGAGAVYEYLAHGAHPAVGVLCAGIYGLGVLCFGCGGFIAFGFLAQAFFEAHLSIDVEWWLWAAAGLVLAVGLSHWGVRLAIRGVVALAGVGAIAFVILAVAIIVQGGTDGNTLAVFDPSHTSLSSVFNGVLFAVTLFIGFEAAASIGEEAHEPKHSIPVAVIGTVAVCGVFYLLVTYAAAIGFGAEGAAEAWPADPAAMTTLANHYVGKGLGTIIGLTVVLDGISLLIAFVVTGSRLFYVLGRDGLLPAPAAAISPHGTPLGGNLVMACGAVAALLFAKLSHFGAAAGVPDNIEAFTILSAAGSFLIEAIYFILVVFAWRIVWSMGRRGLWWRGALLLVGMAAPVLAYKGSLDPWPSYPTSLGVIFAFAGAAIALAWFAYLRLAHPERVRTAAQAQGAHHGTPPLDEDLAFEPVDEGVL